MLRTGQFRNDGLKMFPLLCHFITKTVISMSFIFKILFLKKSFLCTHPNLNTDIFLPRLKIFEVILDQIFK